MATYTLTSSVSVGFVAQHTGTGVANGIGTSTNVVNKQVNTTFANGTAANQCDLVYTVTGTLSSSTTIDLSTGSIKDSFGNTVSFVKIKAIFAYNKETTETNKTLLIGGNGTNPFAAFLGDATDVVKVPAGGVFVVTAPLTTAFGVTNSSSDILKLDTSSGSVEYELGILGTSA